MNAHYKMQQRLNSAFASVAERTIESDLMAAWKQSGVRQFESIGCVVEDDSLTLIGQLDTFYLSQLAQAIAWKIGGVASVENNIAVASPI